MADIAEKTWEEFRDSGCLWRANRILHLIGWAIVVEIEDGKINRAYPARVKFRGFASEAESEGFVKLTSYIASNIEKAQPHLTARKDTE